MARDKLGDERPVKTNEGRDVEMDTTLLKPSQILTIGKRRIKCWKKNNLQKMELSCQSSTHVLLKTLEKERRAPVSRGGDMSFPGALFHALVPQPTSGSAERPVVPVVQQEKEGEKWEDMNGVGEGGTSEDEEGTVASDQASITAETRAPITTKCVLPSDRRRVSPTAGAQRYQMQVRGKRLGSSIETNQLLCAALVTLPCSSST
ncbi:hypothetical protein EYF80_018729 [Liparis tanakae]|uniref:Uncharacterized protein n=1 Tax=Liparis tanakae TaxID=230148 RepID=A0A4Z2HZH0_9TELE|nr:hypothetical protein EYF80_018729 [Liparis tanakae]